MKKLIFLTTIGIFTLFTQSFAGNTGKPVNNPAVSSSGTVIPLTNETFQQKVFNYKLNKQWKYEGNLPAIVDFYANWCGPCRQLSPRIEEIAKEYAGKIVVYKVDTDQEKLLSQSLGITSLPTLLFIPVKGQPQATMGALPKETLVKAVQEVLLVK
jgi:thioredoxin 1